MMTIDPRRLCQIEIQTSDMPRALAFYEAAFGWRRIPADIYEVVVLEVPESCPFGISLVPWRGGQGETRKDAIPPQGGDGKFTLYFAVDDPEETVRKVEAAGGRRRFGPMRLAGYGTIYQVEDPEGARFGLFKA